MRKIASGRWRKTINLRWGAINLALPVSQTCRKEIFVQKERAREQERKKKTKMRVRENKSFFEKPLPISIEPSEKLPNINRRQATWERERERSCG